MNLWGIDEGEDAADLYRYLVGELDKLQLGYLHITQYGLGEQLLHDIRKLWRGTLVLNRPGRAREDIVVQTSQVGWQILSPTGRWFWLTPILSNV